MNSPVDISPNHLTVVLGILRKHLPDDVKVWVFGSRANWTTKDSSDLDLALEGDSVLDHDTIVALETAFEESILPYKVDIIDLNQVSGSFRRIVDAQKAIFPIMEDRRNAGGNWHTVSLGSIVDLRISGVDKKTKNDEQLVQLCNYTDVYNNSFINASMDFMTATATEREIFKCLLSDGDVIITKDSEKHDDIGVPALVRGDVPNLVCGYHLAILRPTPKIDGAYLYYALNADGARHQFQSYANGITRFGLRKADIGLVEIPLPSLGEQRGIASILRTLDDKIILNRRMNQTLEEMARTLFKSWFVDFDPVRAKMDERWLSSESLPGLPAHLYKLFPNDLVDSELGEIPEGWKVRALGDLLQLCYGKALHAKDRQQGTIPVYGSNGKIGSHNERLVSGPGIVVGRKGNPGTVTWIQNDFFPIDTTFYVIPTSTDLNLPFLLHALKDQNLSTMASDSAVPGLNRNVAYMNKQIVPNKDIADEFASCASALFKRCDHLNNESLFLTAQRDALLPKLVSGALHPANIIKSVRRAPR